MTKKSVYGDKLQHLFLFTGLSEDQFIHSFIEHSKPSSFRPDDIREWITDNRKIYNASLLKLGAFWQTLVPGFTAAHFLMPFDDFKAALKPKVSTQETGVMLPVTPAPLIAAMMTTLVGCYRIFRYAVNANRIVSEVVSIRPRPNTDEPTLEAELWSPTMKAPQRFKGAVIVMGDMIYLVLSDQDGTSSAMRFISVKKSDHKDRHWHGLASGSFGNDDQLSSMTVVLERMTTKTSLEDADPTWITLDGLESITSDVLVHLQRPLKL